MKTTRWIAPVAVLTLLAACTQLFGPRDNPADPGAGTYPGYRVVERVAQVTPDSPAARGSTSWLAFMCSRCDAADLYAILIEDSEGAGVYTRSDFSTQEMSLTDASLEAGTYTWSVRAHEEGGDWSQDWSSRSTVTLAGVTGDVTPADGAVISDTTPLLDWGDVTDAAGYEVQIADSEAGVASAPVLTTGSESQYQVASALAYGTWYWRVRPVNGDATPGAWTQVFSFTLTWTVDFGTITPTDGGVISDTTPLLDWGDVTDAASYEVQIADSSAGVASTAVLTTGSESEYQVASALAYGTWYWRVRPVNADDVPGAWSTTWLFLLMDIPEGYAYVPGGTFSMGSTTGYSDEAPVHDVTVSSFLISKYEVTQAQYQTVMGTNPSYFTGDPSRPVEQVDWYDVVAFCNALSGDEGLDSCYTINGSSVSCDFTKNGYRLPTEAEWEFAARGGNSSAGHTYSGSSTAGDVAWYDYNSGSTTHPVGTKAANELGIYDMSGNVWEWCWDWYGSYGSSAETDPTGPTSGVARVLHGGSWANDASYARSAARSAYEPGDAGTYYSGLRVVRRAGM